MGQTFDCEVLTDGFLTDVWEGRSILLALSATYKPTSARVLHAFQFRSTWQATKVHGRRAQLKAHLVWCRMNGH